MKNKALIFIFICVIMNEKKKEQIERKNKGIK